MNPARLFLILPLAASLVAHAALNPPSNSREAARLNNLGTALMNQQLIQKGADKFAQAYAADPTLAIAKINQGIALLYLQQLPQAEQALQLAAAEATHDPHLWYALGLLYRNQNLPRQALEAFDKTISLDPSDPDAHYSAASIDVELNDLPAAIAEYRRALALNPLHVSALFGLARALQRQGHTTEAHTALVEFQRLTTEKLASPFAHTYGDEGRYAQVEVASLPVTSILAMVPITYRESWRFPALPTHLSGAACLIPSTSGSNTLVLMGSGSQAVRLFRQNAATFDAISTAQTGIDIPGTGIACAAGDYDNDGLPDLALAIHLPTGEDQILLYRDLGNGRFENVSKSSGIVSKNRPTSLTFVDFDHDGDLDLFITGSPTSSTPNLL